MFCVIQEIEVKKSNPYGTFKELEWYGCNINGYDKYFYHHTGECFERSIKRAYKISIHQSYRENGKIKKKQYCIGTINYYDILNDSLYDDYYRRIKVLSNELNTSEEEIVDCIDEKLTALTLKVKNEFEKTEEYKTIKKHEEIINNYSKAKQAFAEKYNTDIDDYDYCYNVFGELKSQEYLNKVIDKTKTYNEYSSYYKNYSGNYNNDSYKNYSSDYTNSGYCKINSSNYIEDEKKYLKKFYKILAQTYHPDNNIDKDTTTEMKLINKIKEEWDI